MQRRAPSSSRLYLRKSFFSTRIRMVARKPVSSSTVTQLLMMLNQWICGETQRQVTTVLARPWMSTGLNRHEGAVDDAPCAVPTRTESGDSRAMPSAYSIVPCARELKAMRNLQG